MGLAPDIIGNLPHVLHNGIITHSHTCAVHAWRPPFKGQRGVCVMDFTPTSFAKCCSLLGSDASRLI